MRKLVQSLTFVVCIWSASVEAQMSGKVVDVEGRPVAAVLVELWTDTSRVASTMTDAGGVFSFSASFAQSGTRLTLSRIGYFTHAVSLRLQPASQIYVMAVRPLSLTQLSSSGETIKCPANDQNAASTIWRLAQRKYQPLDDTTRIHTWLSAGTGFVPIGSVGNMPEAEMFFKNGQAVWSAAKPSVESRIRNSGYAWPREVKPGLAIRLFRDDFDRWEYPALESKHAFHFASLLFADNHVMGIASESESDWVLVFCPARRNRPALKGTIQISKADTSLISAEWRFVGQSPSERAGGEVVFAPPSALGSTPTFLAAARGVYWRYSEKLALYYHRVMVFTSWRAERKA